MNIWPRSLLLLPLAALLACGSSPTNSSAAPYNFNGEWHGATPILGVVYSPFDQIDAELQVSNGVVTGTLYTYSSLISHNFYACSTDATSTTEGTALTATGTLDDDHNLTLNFPINSGTGTILAALGDDPSTYVSGSMQVSGGTCAMSATQIEIHNTSTTPTTNSSSTATNTADLSGNWSMGTTSTAAVGYTSSTTTTILGFRGALQFSNGSVSGTMIPSVNYESASCYATFESLVNNNDVINTPIAFTGTLDASNNLTLTAPLAGGTATITATLGSNAQTWADASYQIVGGSCAMSATSMTIAQIAPVTGTYIGTFTQPSFSGTDVPIAGGNITVTAVLTQSTTANADGSFPLTGTITTTGAVTGTTTITGNVGGGSFSTSSTVLGYGYMSPDASTIYYAASDGGVNAETGTLVRQ
jgi:hypothetical protein